MSQRDRLLWAGIGKFNEPPDLIFCMGCSLPSLIGSNHNFEIVCCKDLYLGLKLMTTSFNAA